MIFFVMAGVAFVLSLFYIVAGFKSTGDYASVFYETFFILMLDHGLFSVIRLFL